MIKSVSMILRFKKFKNYELYLSHYLSASALISDAMLNMKKVELELISDADLHLFFEKGMRFANITRR